MTAQRLRVGQLVSAADPAALADLCPAYTVRSRHAIVVAADEHQAAVKWIDYRGLQHDTCVLPPTLLQPGTLNAAARTRVIHCRRTDTALPGATPAVVPHNADPTIEIRELRIFPSRSSEIGTGLLFHTVQDANVALHALADAQEAFPVHIRARPRQRGLRRRHRGRLPRAVHHGLPSRALRRR
jgi:hypothetical protein